MIEINKTYERKIKSFDGIIIRRATVTKIDLLNGQIHYDLVEVVDEDNIQVESIYSQISPVDWFTRHYIKFDGL